MSECCSGPRVPRSLVIETTVLRVEGETCDRCGDTVEAARSAAGELEDLLGPLGVRVTLLEHATTAEHLGNSNTVLINGRAIDEWIGAERVSTDCPSCGDLTGQTACCGAVSVGGAVQESYTAEQTRDAALTALGVVDAGGCC